MRPINRMVDAVDDWLDDHVHEGTGRDPGSRRVRLSAFDETLRRHLEARRTLRESAAQLLFLRNKLEAEQTERRVRLARACHGILRAARMDDDETALPLIRYRQMLRRQVERAEEELAGVRTQAVDAKRELAILSSAIRDMDRERDRARAVLSRSRSHRRPFGD